WVCMEAMAAGRPVICLDLGGPAVQVTEETGFKIAADEPYQVVRDLAEVNKVTLIVGSWQKDYFELFFNSQKIQLISIEIQNSSLARNIWFLLGLPKFAKHFSPDIVHLSFPVP
ncbi:MAG: glycosyltransferase family 4 protein, partial [Dolichospermum sp.]